MIILIALTLLSQRTLGRDECTTAAVDACTQPLQRFGLEDKAIFPQLFEGELDQLCDERKDTERCLRPLLRDCDRFQRRHFEGMEDAYDFICSNSARKTYFKNWHCLDDRKLLREARRCNNTYQDSLRKTRKNVYKYSFKEIKENRCSYLNTYLLCLKSALEDTDKCVDSKAIAAWQYDIHKLALKGVAKEIDCDISEPLLTTAEIVGIVIGGVAFLVLVILLVYFCTCNVSRYRQKKARVSYEGEEAPIKQKKIPTVTISAPKKYEEEDDESEEEEEEEEEMEENEEEKEEESKHDHTYESFPERSLSQHNGQLSSRTKEKLKLQLPVTPTSARKPIYERSRDSGDTQSEASGSDVMNSLPAQKTRSKRGDKRRMSGKESDSENVKIF